MSLGNVQQANRGAIRRAHALLPGAHGGDAHVEQIGKPLLRQVEPLADLPDARRVWRRRAIPQGAEGRGRDAQARLSGAGQPQGDRLVPHGGRVLPRRSVRVESGDVRHADHERVIFGGPLDHEGVAERRRDIGLGDVDPFRFVGHCASPRFELLHGTSLKSRRR